MGKSVLDISRLYFLSYDDRERENLFSSLSDEEKDSIIEIGAAFTSHDGIVGLARHPLLSKYVDELKDLQIEYFIFLSELLSEGKTNLVIEKLKQTENELFAEVLKKFSDNQSFERDLVKGINKIEREEQKYNLTLLDKNEDELGIPDHEIKFAISQIERGIIKKKLQEFDLLLVEENIINSAVPSVAASQAQNFQSKRKYFRPWMYAVAAASLVFIVLTIGLRYQFNEKPIIESKNYSAPGPGNKNYNTTSNRKTILVPLGQDNKRDTINFEIIGLSTIIKENIESSDKSFYSGMGRRVRYIDSLKSLICKYYFDIKSKSVLVYLVEMPNDINVRVIRDSGSPEMYLMLDSFYYKIEPNDNFTELIPVVKHSFIDSSSKLNIIYK